MIDVKLLRNNPDALKRAISKKKYSVDINTLIVLDKIRRSAITKAEAARSEQKAKSFKLRYSREYSEHLKMMKAVAENVKILEVEANSLESSWRYLLLQVPNPPHYSVPIGNSKKDNVVIYKWGDIKKLVTTNAIPYWDISWLNKGIDFNRGSKVTSSGFPFYLGNMARLVRAMISFFLEEATKIGYLEMLTPLMVNSNSAQATGHLPDKDEQMYHINRGDNFYLIPTAEVPLTNFYRNVVLEERDLPILCCSHTTCFRREAGSWGARVRGINRLHQFDKVELVKFTHPDNSFEELEKLRYDSEHLLRKLKLPYRVLLICSGDLGFAHAKQYDIEVWAGGQKKWLEVSSCSNFTDFQSRRANISYRSDRKNRLIHTLNGSGLAIPRVLAALLENNLQEDESVYIPKCLYPWMGNIYHLKDNTVLPF